MLPKPGSTDSRGASPPWITAGNDRPSSKGAHPEDARPIAPDGAHDAGASTDDRWIQAEAPPLPRLSRELTPFEVASSILLGPDGEQPPRRSRPLEPLPALKAALLPALCRAPCLIAFSGGVDSSALLAVATRLARQEGLPEPIPVTSRFPQAPLSVEDDWQERIVTALGLREWLRLEHGDDLDLVGPVAQEVLTRHGVLYPYNLHLFVPFMRAAAGGSLVTGMGGDQLFAPAGRPLDVLGRRVPAQRRDLLRIAGAMAPRAVRLARNRRLYTLSFPWLTPSANAELDRRAQIADTRFPLWWNARARATARARYVRLVIRHMAAVAADHGVEMSHPFIEDGFVDAVARAGGLTGFRNRAAAMTEMLGDEVPVELMSRTTKATFDEVLWGAHTRAFVERLDEERLAPALRALEVDSLVDPPALIAHWSAPWPASNSFLLLQGVWLALEGLGS